MSNKFKKKSSAQQDEEASKCPTEALSLPPVWVPNPGHVALPLSVHLSRLLPLLPPVKNGQSMLILLLLFFTWFSVIMEETQYTLNLGFGVGFSHKHMAAAASAATPFPPDSFHCMNFSPVIPRTGGESYQ